MASAADRPTRHRVDLGLVQLKRRYALVALSALVLLGLPFVASRQTGAVHEAIEAFGLVLIGTAALGRIWSILYIGGRKTREMVRSGPYSISRNPLYLFSLIGVAGIGCQSGSLLFPLFLTAASLAIFIVVIRREEAVLESVFGQDYLSYKADVPRFGPRLATWRDDAQVVVEPRLFWRTAREVLLFFLAFPLFEAVELLQNGGWTIPILRLP